MLIGQLLDGSLGDFGRAREVALVAGGAGQLGQAAEDDALVVGPGDAVVVVAAVVEAVVDEVLGVDHAAVLEPLPLVLGDLEVLLVAGDAVGERGGDGEVQLVGNGVYVGAVLVPVDAAVARPAEAGLHVLEDGDGGIEEKAVVGDVVGVDEAERPPALVIVVLVEKVLEAALGKEVVVGAVVASLAAAVAQGAVDTVLGLHEAAGVHPLGGLHVHPLRLEVGVDHDPDRVGRQGVDGAQLHKVGDGGEGVAAVPPQVVPEAGPVAVPIAVQRIGGNASPVGVSILALAKVIGIEAALGGAGFGASRGGEGRLRCAGQDERLCPRRPGGQHFLRLCKGKETAGN